jgi:class 3 adenylate cyclase
MRADYVSSISHEPRTPLTSICGSIGLFQAGAIVGLPASAVEMVRIAYKNSARLVRIINDILDIGRLEAGQILHLLSIPLAERIPPASAPSKRQPNVPRNRAIVTLKRASDAPGIAAEMTHATVLFADMRGYTGLAERLRPVRVVSLLDEFFSVLARVTMTFGGEVFHMAGDSMMAGFGVRDPTRSGARAALAAGCWMLQSFAPVAARWRNEFAVITGIGIGVHSGEIAMGSLGPPGRQVITMIGDTANVAARLCDRARAGEVLFSGAIAAALRTDDDGLDMGVKPFLQLPQFELRGRSELLDIWCVPASERLRH